VKITTSLDNKLHTLELKTPELNLMFDALTDLAIELEDRKYKAGREKNSKKQIALDAMINAINYSIHGRPYF
jgi:hypothetical protein